MFAIFPILSVALCMLFPASLENDFIRDLRRIPLILGMLYGGPVLSIFLLSMILTARFFTGGDGLIIPFISYSFLFIAIMLVSRHKEHASPFTFLLVNRNKTYTRFGIGFSCLSN
ncbi:hypothetical protein NLX67_01220 [Domibacillus sp. A3M-37]|uniref:LytS/YhcK type 5TM receptor domain-containing protein n=1 Tax=Domibacillus TaxID=1433999 RepID=UPI0020B82EAB|nr:LytS/YhcK type 5TM receptor domain-containing protein [Domibacillus sp. A3M-37]MCP3761015.1 hypothetical protein [Domibacillus sp. A3M-37]